MTPCPMCRTAIPVNSSQCAKCGCSIMTSSQRQNHQPDTRVPSTEHNSTVDKAVKLCVAAHVTLFGSALLAGLSMRINAIILIIITPILAITSMVIAQKAINEIKISGELGRYKAVRVLYTSGCILLLYLIVGIGVFVILRIQNAMEGGF